MHLKIDTEFQNLIPPLSDEEFRQLEENIKAEGCRDSLVTWNGTIVDGHNRYKICQENSIPFKEEEKEFSDREEVIEWILKNQLGRRNLNDMQRTKIALRYKEVIAEKMKGKMSVRGKQQAELLNKGKGGSYDQPLEKTTQRKEIAKIAGVSEGNVYRAKTILEKGTPEQVARAEKGGKGNSVGAIFKEITGKAAPEKDKPAEPEPETEKFDFNKLSRKEQREREQELVDALKNPNIERKLSAEALVGQIEANLLTALNTLESMLKDYSDLVMVKENNPQIIAVLSEAETAIKKLKGKYLYE